MAYIIGTYNKWNKWDREHAVYKFEMNGQWYAIKEVQMEWGLPQLPTNTMQDERLDMYRIYDTYEDAMQFVFIIKQANRV